MATEIKLIIESLKMADISGGIQNGILIWTPRGFDFTKNNCIRI